MKKKKKIIFLIVLLILLGIGVYFYFNYNRLKLEGYLKIMGKDIYENRFYDETDEAGYYSQFEKDGLKIPLSTMLYTISDEYEEEMIDFIYNSQCDTEETRAIIYPRTPYGKTNYDIKIELKDCK